MAWARKVKIFQVTDNYFPAIHVLTAHKLKQLVGPLNEVVASNTVLCT